MRVLKQNPWLPSLGVLLAAVMIAGYARADVTTDEPGSIVIFPKVISDGSRDTLIQLTNTSTSTQHVTCVYVDTSTASPGTCSGTTPPVQSCETDADCFANDNGFCVRCQALNYLISLTPLQPTVWRVSAGRDEADQDHGIFIGKIKPYPLFQGEVKCFQTDIDGVPIGGNALKGEATLENISSGQISEYNGIAIKAINAQTVMPTCVGGSKAGSTCSTNSDCDGTPSGVCNVSLSLDNSEYNACPRQLLVNHYGGGAEDPATGATVTSELTLVPCSESLETGPPTSTSVTFNEYNEFEQFVVSKIVPFTCWLNITIGDAQSGDPRITPGFDVSTLGSTFAKTRLFTSTGDQKTCAGGISAGNFCNADGDCTGSTCSGPPASGILGVLEEFHDLNGDPTGTAAVNLHVTGSRTLDTINLMPSQ